MPVEPPVYLRITDLAKRWRVCRQHVHTITKKPGFPPAFRPTTQIVLYRLDLIEAWEAANHRANSASQREVAA